MIEKKLDLREGNLCQVDHNVSSAYEGYSDLKIYDLVVCVCVWQTDVYCMCHSIFVQCHLSLLFPVNHILHVSLSIDNAPCCNSVYCHNSSSELYMCFS